MSTWPKTETLLLDEQRGVLHVTFNRPERRNALSSRMVEELIEVFSALHSRLQLRAVVVRGAGGTFCAGADLKDMNSARSAQPAAEATADPRSAAARNNRRFGVLMSAVSAAPQPVIAAVEGSVMGGGIGIVCASDVALAARDARFGLPETGLGLIPAQIAPFVVQRIGLTHARRLMVTGARVDAAEAAQLGLVHELCDDSAALDAALERVLGQIRRCAPQANAATKKLVLATPGRALESVLDEAALVFADAALSEEAREGTLAFVQKRLPKWAE
ncbi:MAG TPA: enoyl-CoA hydratase-related protein [Polyangiales bacterium]|nr:enoyl-CoA hydratase-related protein [Polyangiales bacterium]